jgi:hypothetical protein
MAVGAEVEVPPTKAHPYKTDAIRIVQWIFFIRVFSLLPGAHAKRSIHA